MIIADRKSNGDSIPKDVLIRSVTMPTLNYIYRLPTLFIFLLILPQCSEKSSIDYVKEGYQYIEQQDYTKAENAFLNAIEKDPKNADGFYGLGGIHNNNKKYDKAIEAFQKVLTLDPTHFNAYFSLGYSHEQKGNKKEAEKYFLTYKRLKQKMETILNEGQKKS
ncbi:MAG: tetratricopeptide repeat protein [Nitrospinales bacterium]